jgi:steroid delta-isomerase-like uncharacterized protein
MKPLYMLEERMTVDATGIVEMYLEAWNSHDSDLLLSFFTDDCVYEDVALGRLERGKDKVRTLIRSIFVDVAEFRMEPKSAFGVGDWGATEWIMTGRFVHSSIASVPASGKRFAVRGATILELSNGKIRRNSDYLDLPSFVRQTKASREIAQYWGLAQSN